MPSFQACVDERMDGWMHDHKFGWTDRWMDGRMNGRWKMDGQVSTDMDDDGLVDVKGDGWMDGLTDRWVDGQTDG